MKKQRHHYVWQKYLEPWAPSGSIFCLRANRTFSASTKNIGMEKGFYKIKRLSGEELEFVKKLAESSPSDVAKQTNHRWIDNHTAIYDFQDLAEAEDLTSPELEELIDENVFNLEENMQMHIENTGAPHLENILKDDLSFYSDDNCCMEFVFYLATQFVRTKKMREIIQEAGKQVGILDMSGCWPIVSHIFATNFGWSMYAERKEYGISLLTNRSAMNLISADQPVINIHPLGNDADHDICLYYPVSPRKAILYSSRNTRDHNSKQAIGGVEATEYNNKMFEASHEQAYALQESDLQRYL